MKTVKLQWKGSVPTLIRTEVNGPKVDMLCGDVLEVEEALALRYAKENKDLVIVGQGSVEAKEPVLQQPKAPEVKKGVPKKAKS